MSPTKIILQLIHMKIDELSPLIIPLSQSGKEFQSIMYESTSLNFQKPLQTNVMQLSLNRSKQTQLSQCITTNELGFLHILTCLSKSIQSKVMCR